jgi:hypothetical protein
MTEADLSFVPETEVVRAAMLKNICHPPKYRPDNWAT